MEHTSPRITVRNVIDYAPILPISNDTAAQVILTKEKNRLVVVDGFVHPSKLREFAVRSDLAQMLFHPHTDIIRSATLPSQPLGFLVVRFISIGRYAEANGDGSPDSDIRDQMRNMASHNEVKINGFANFRGLKIYGQGFFTVEQQAIFMKFLDATNSSDRLPWSGLLLDDAGGSIPEWPPWTDPRLSKASFLHPKIHDFRSVYETGRAGEEPGSVLQVPNPFEQQEMDRNSATHFAASLLTASALCYSQFVAFVRNMLQHLPVDDGAAGSRSARNINSNNNTAESIRLLHQARADLTDAVDYFDEALQFCQAEVNVALILSLQSDLKTLRAKAINVSSLCKEKSDAIYSNMALQVSNEALREGKRMTLVTYLGVTYAAVALSSSIFGMNVKGLGGTVPVYYFVVVSISIGLMTTAFVVIFGRYGAYMDEVIHSIFAKKKIY
ncbi:hypothetical protein F503_06848 [Ophiostoma piceae UAMH 11346]|uniref:Magnesium transporter n=1 Tax=Ophiostoma piceae (strain UAMH 11346) TaxID=1262450 RepID=S3C8A4_OPHP1|nr:hypothetical protein F503_06848 [Ophiostoma piceae UAMH 11346]